MLYNYNKKLSLCVQIICFRRRTSFSCRPIGQNGNVVSGGHGDSDNVLQIRFTGKQQQQQQQQQQHNQTTHFFVKQSSQKKIQNRKKYFQHGIV